MRILNRIMESIKAKPESPETSELIRLRAYELWEENGRPESDGVEFWLQAEKELASD
jgi:hypothetical protein